MPFHNWDTLPDEVISPHYSTAIGGTITGAVIEVGRYRIELRPGPRGAPGPREPRLGEPPRRRPARRGRLVPISHRHPRRPERTIL